MNLGHVTEASGAWPSLAFGCFWMFLVPLFWQADSVVESRKPTLWRMLQQMLQLFGIVTNVDTQQHFQNKQINNKVQKKLNTFEWFEWLWIVIVKTARPSPFSRLRSRLGCGEIELVKLSCLHGLSASKPKFNQLCGCNWCNAMQDFYRADFAKLDADSVKEAACMH